VETLLGRRLSCGSFARGQEVGEAPVVRVIAEVGVFREVCQDLPSRRQKSTKVPLFARHCQYRDRNYNMVVDDKTRRGT